jgi:hypothetical protein
MKFASAIAILMLSVAANAMADPPGGFGHIYAHGEVYRTFGVPAAAPMGGRDDIYAIKGGVEGQLNVSAVAPGDKDFHGGLWAIWVVMWHMDVEPYLLTSEEDVMQAFFDGDLSIDRMPDADFRCPVIPGRGHSH